MDMPFLFKRLERNIVLTTSKPVRSVWAIGDLHLSIGLRPELAKPMDIFGDFWQDHAEQIENAWRLAVGSEDIVLIPGDICWGNKPEDALPTLEWLAALPGQKILGRGNHDNWWQSIGRLREQLPSGVQIIHNDAVCIQGMAFGGSRGWSFFDQEGGRHQEKMMRREAMRLEASLSKFPQDASVRFALLHFPPFKRPGVPSIFTDILQKYQVNYCVYGHLHGDDCASFEPVLMNSTKFQLVSSDYLDFSPQNIYNWY